MGNIGQINSLENTANFFSIVILDYIGREHIMDCFLMSVLLFFSSQIDLTGLFPEKGIPVILDKVITGYGYILLFDHCDPGYITSYSKCCMHVQLATEFADK